MAFEETFDTEIPDEEMAKIRSFRATLEKVCNCLRKRKKGGDSN